MPASEKPAKDKDVHFDGSCACTRITYNVHAIPNDCCACHCATCRKLSGAAFQVFYHINSKDVTFYDNKENLRYEGLPKNSIGGISILRLSDVGERAFCLDCHTPLAMRYKHEMHVTSLTLGTVNEHTFRDASLKEALRPKARIFMEQNAWWFQPPPGEGLRMQKRFGGTFEDDMQSWEEREKR